MSPSASLPVAGLTRLSTCDWPGRLAATVFLQGCPWRCTYCHNPGLLDPRMPGRIPWPEVLTFLRRRRGLLDGAVLSGGEPTRWPDLPLAAAEIKVLGLGVGLHTAGPYPHRLTALLDVVDWVGLDIKALPEDYPLVVGRSGGGDRAWRSLALVVARGVPHEVRTTVHPGSPAVARLPELARRLWDAGVRSFVVQEARTVGVRGPLEAAAPGWESHLARLADVVAGLGFEHTELRRSA